jgi:Ca2+-binding EF-hand superfamily protein
MGCGSSQAPYEISQLESDLFRELKLSKQEVDKLLKVFNEIDLDGSGMIRMDELFGTCRIEETNCNKKIFGMFDGDDSGTLNFSEFGESVEREFISFHFFPRFSILVCAMWMFLASTDNDLAQFIYNLFDSDRSGSLDVTEVKSIISTVHQKLLNGRNPVNRLLDDLSKKNHRMTSEEFVAWTKTNPSLLEPIFHLHLGLRNQLVGVNFWQTLQVRRYANGNQMSPQYIDLIQKRLDKISRDLEKRASTSTASRSSKKQKKKVHPSSDKAKEEKKAAAASSDKKQRTAEKNTLLAEADHPAAAVPRKKSSAGVETEEKKPRKKSNAGLTVDTSAALGTGAAPGIASGDPHKHHHHHHHKQHPQEDSLPPSASSTPSHHHGHHHHGHHHHGRRQSADQSGASSVPPSPAAAPRPHRSNLSESRTSSL